MRKLSTSEKQILDRLIFPESVDVIQEETNLQFGEIRDDIINLMNARLIEAIDPDKPEPRGTSFYDADNLKNYTFRITNSGLKHLANLK